MPVKKWSELCSEYRNGNGELVDFIPSSQERDHLDFSRGSLDPWPLAWPLKLLYGSAIGHED